MSPTGIVAREESGLTIPVRAHTPAGPEDRGIEHAASSGAWLRRTLEEIVGALRDLFELSGCAFLVVDWERRHISPAAAWFASDAVRNTFGAVLDPPTSPSAPGSPRPRSSAGRRCCWPTSASGRAPKRCGAGSRSSCRRTRRG